MAYLYGLIAALWLLLSPSSSFAQVDVPVKYKGGCGGVGSPDFALSPTQLCIGQAGLAAGYVITGAVPGNGIWYCNGTQHGVPTTFPSCPVQRHCDTGFTYDAARDVCTKPSPVCTPPQILNPTKDACIDPKSKCPPAGTNAGDWNGPGRNGEKVVCNMQAFSGDPAKPGCFVVGLATFSAGSGDPPQWQWSAKMRYTGDACAPGAGGTDAGDFDPGKQCTPPQVRGTFNGQVVCYTPSNDPSKPTQTSTPTKTTTTTNPNGTQTSTSTGAETTCSGGRCSTVTTTTTTITNADGTQQPSKTTTTTSTCVQGPGCSIYGSRPNTATTTTTTTTNTQTNTSGSTTPTSTTTNSDSTTTTTTTNDGNSSGNDNGSGNGSGGGGAGGTDENGDGEKDASMFAGACDAPPVCQGDAILCAVAAATFQTNCVLSDPKKPTPLYDAALTKTGDQTGALAGNSTITVGSNSFDQTEFLGAAVGMSDVSITVMSSTISVPFSSINVWLARLGAIFQAITFLLCARIVVRG